MYYNNSLPSRERGALIHVGAHALYIYYMTFCFFFLLILPKGTVLFVCERIRTQYIHVSVYKRGNLLITITHTHTHVHDVYVYTYNVHRMRVCVHRPVECTDAPIYIYTHPIDVMCTG